MLLQELEIHSGNVDTISPDLLRAFFHESYAHTQDHTSSLRLIEYTLNTTTHFCLEISETASELRNDTTRLRH